MFLAAKTQTVALAAATLCTLAVLADVAVSRSPVPLAYFALAALTIGVHVSSLDKQARRLVFSASIVASAGAIALMVAKFA